MEPTIRNGDYLLVEKISLYRGRIKKYASCMFPTFRGDIVVAKQPREPGNCCHILKRVLATGGESVNYWSPELAKNVTVHVRYFYSISFYEN